MREEEEKDMVEGGERVSEGLDSLNFVK